MHHKLEKGIHQIPSNVQTNYSKVKTLYVSGDHLDEWAPNFGSKLQKNHNSQGLSKRYIVFHQTHIITRHKRLIETYIVTRAKK